MFFPMWCMFAFQHYLIKSFDIGIFSAMEIVLNKNYLFSLIKEDWIGVSNIIFHTLLFLWLMKKFDFFGPLEQLKLIFKQTFYYF